MEDINKALEVSIIPNDARDLVVDYSELALDKIFDDNVLNEIPVIKTIVGIYKTGVGIKERFIAKKVATFLFTLRTIPEEEKLKFFNKLSLNEKYKNEVIERLLILLDRLDDLDKAEIIGNLFKATIQGNIVLDNFLKLSSIVDRIYIADLKGFCYRHDYNLDNAIRSEIINAALFPCSNDVKKNLAALGLMKETITATTNQLQFGSNKLDYSFEYRTTELGDEMIKYAKPTFKRSLGQS